MKTEEREERAVRRESVRRPPVEETDLPVLELLAHLWRARLRLLLGAILGGLVLGGWRLTLPKVYTSDGTILFPSAAPAAGGLLAGLADSEAAMSNLPFAGGAVNIPQPGANPGTAILILQSRTATAEIVKRLKMPIPPKATVDDVAKSFAEQMKLVPGKNGDLTIKVTDGNPVLARNAVNEAIAQLQRSIEELSLDPATRSVSFLRKQLSEAERSFAAAQAKAVAFQREHGAVPADAQIQQLGQRYSALQDSIASAQVDLDVQRARIAKTTSVSRDLIADAQDPAGSGSSSLAGALYRKTVECQTKLELLRQEYTEAHPQVVLARQELDQAKRDLQAEIHRQLTALSGGKSPVVSDAVVAAAVGETRLEGLRKAAEAVRARLERLPGLQAEQTRLAMDVESEKAQVASLRAEYRRAVMVTNKQGPRFVVLDPPLVPKDAERRRILLFGMVGAMLGICLMALKPLADWLLRGTV